MSEAPQQEVLTKEEIQSRFQLKCAQAGDLEYRSRVLQANLQSIYQEISELNKKAAELPKETQAEVVQ